MTSCAFRAIDNVKQAALGVPGPHLKSPRACRAYLSNGREWWKMRAPVRRAASGSSDFSPEHRGFGPPGMCHDHTP
jgi:hypothetical protein